MNVREIYNVLLVRMGIRKVLPSAYVKKKEIRECGENKKLLQRPNIISAFGESLYGRESVVEKLEFIADKLAPKKLGLVVFELFRSKEKQLEMLEIQKRSLKKQFPAYSKPLLLRELNKRVAVGGGGHQTGGAVDLTICDLRGNLLDMGSSYLQFDASTPTFSKLITVEQEKNRTILLSIMQEVGFVNFPLEWWHFSYGDKMWAAYKNKPYAIYGCLDS